jgi:hypothetical protein
VIASGSPSNGWIEGRLQDQLRLFECILHLPGEAIATPVDRLDQLGLLMVVLDGVTGFLNAANQCFVTDISPTS